MPLAYYNYRRIQRAFARMLREIASYAVAERTENFYPIMSAPLTKHSGIDVTGRFVTDDDTTTGRLSYVTVLRDADSADPSNGFGFAWSIGDGVNYNVYLVDHSPLANDLFISPTFVVNPQGENAFRAAARVEILANTTYLFKLTIGEDYSSEIRIWEEGGAEPSVADATVGAPLIVSANGTNFGIGILGTYNCEWWYDDLKIETTSGVHTAVLYRMKARSADFPDDTITRINHYGYGYDGTDWGLNAYLKRKVDTAWVWSEIGNNVSQDISDKSITKISNEFIIGSDYRDVDEFVDLLVTSTYANTAVTDVTSYYVNLETASPSGIHSGGCADIYIHDPKALVTAEQTLNNITGVVELSSGNGFLSPIHSIVEVQISIIGEPLTKNTDWTLVTPNIATALSTQENPYLNFSPGLVNTKVRVIYRYYVHGSAIQTLLESEKYRYSGTSNLAKIMPPIIVQIDSLQYRGPMSVRTVQDEIINYIGELGDTITKTEIINILYRLGASYVDIPNLEIYIVETDYKRQMQDPVLLVDSYERADLSRFFTDYFELAGIVKL